MNKKNNITNVASQVDATVFASDISENTIRELMPTVLDILLMDRTTNKNIIWANDHYVQLGYRLYAPTAQMKPDLITGNRDKLIMPRALKSRQQQKDRTKERAEVFTPTWVVKKQNDEVDQAYQSDTLSVYIARKWLEITCGEAPYMATRYDMETGAILPLNERVGFVDRKLARINAEIEDKAEWHRMVELAYQASYGFEWNGDSLLLARENLLYTYRDYYVAKWQEEPKLALFEQIAKIISYNVFQMDGLKYIIPLSYASEKIPTGWDLLTGKETFDLIEKKGKRVKIMNWDTNKMEFFDKGVK